MTPNLPGCLDDTASRALCPAANPPRAPPTPDSGQTGQPHSRLVARATVPGRVNPPCVSDEAIRRVTGQTPATAVRRTYFVGGRPDLVRLAAASLTLTMLICESRRHVSLAPRCAFVNETLTRTGGYKLGVGR